MSVAQCRHDPVGLQLKGYDCQEPATRSDALLVEALSCLMRVWFAMIRRRDCGHDRVEVGSKLDVSGSRIQDMLVPGVLKQHHWDPLGRRRPLKDDPVAHANARSTASASCSDGW